MIRPTTFVAGDVLPELSKPAITKVQLLKYAGASGDPNLVHVDEDTARSAGLDGVIAHGMLSMGFLGEYAEDIAGEDGWVKRIEARFSEMVRPGDQLTCFGEVAAVTEVNDGFEVDLEIWVTKQTGDIVTRGTSQLWLRGSH